MKKCIFCCIAIDKKINKIYEDNDVIAIFDKSQDFLGHVLIIPKKHYENLLLVPKKVSDKILNIALLIAKIEKNIFLSSGVNILTNIGKDANQTIMHCHVHVIPHKIKINKNINEKQTIIQKKITEKILDFILKNKK